VARPIRAIGLDLTMKDKSLKEYQLFMQNDLDFYQDIRLNNPKIGVVLQWQGFKVFQPLGATYETALFRRQSLEEKFSSHIIEDLFRSLTNQWTLERIETNENNKK
jgi:hypothetical protein